MDGRAISAIALFVEDLAATQAFYEDIFGLSVHSEDPESCVFMLGNILVDLLVEPAVPELISPIVCATSGGITRCLHPHR
jgi:lactoylglutathione lyase